MAQRVTGGLNRSHRLQEFGFFRASRHKPHPRRTQYGQLNISRGLLLAQLDDRSSAIAATVERGLAPQLLVPMIVEVRFTFAATLRGGMMIHLGIVPMAHEAAVGLHTKVFQVDRVAGIEPAATLSPIPHHLQAVEALHTSLGTEFRQRLTDYTTVSASQPLLVRYLYLRVNPKEQSIALPSPHGGAAHSYHAAILPTAADFHAGSLDHALLTLIPQIRAILQRELASHPFVEGDVYVEVGTHLRRCSDKPTVHASVRVISARGHHISEDRLHLFLEHPYFPEPPDPGHRNPSHWTSDAAKRSKKARIRQAVIDAVLASEVLSFVGEGSEIHRLFYERLRATAKTPTGTGPSVVAAQPVLYKAAPAPAKPGVSITREQWVSQIELKRADMISAVREVLRGHPFTSDSIIVELFVHTDSRSRVSTQFSIEVFAAHEARILSSKLENWQTIRQVPEHQAGPSHWVDAETKRAIRGALRSRVQQILAPILAAEIPQSGPELKRFLYISIQR